MAISFAWRLLFACTILMPIACGGPLFAQDNRPPAEIEQKIRSDGPVVDVPGMVAAYAPLQEKEPYADVRVTRGVSYGVDKENVADIFLPSVAPGALRPVIIFVHGGGFNSGARRLDPASPFYDNVCVWAARRGFVCINMDYRLAPAARWPSGVADIDRAVDWARRTAAKEGGDPARIFLMGHSAGATHVASYIGHPQSWSERTPAVRGAIVLSGAFDVTPMDREPADEKVLVERERTYFDPAAARLPEQSSVAGLLDTKIPLLIMNAEFDPSFFRRRADALKLASDKVHRSAQFIIVPNHSHMSEVLSINTSDDSVTRPIEAFIERNQ